HLPALFGLQASMNLLIHLWCFFFQAEDGIRDFHVTGVQTCALPICSNSPQLTTSECRLQDVCGIHGALATSCAYQCVDFVNKENDLSIAIGHLFDDRFKAFFKL